MTYRKKPVEIEVFQFGKDEFPKWFHDEVQRGDISIKDNCAYIKTLEGTMKADKGDFIIKGVKGEIYPCKADIFKQTYEKVDQ